MATSLDQEGRSRLLVTAIDQIARSQPQRTWVAVPKDEDDLSNGFVDITFKQFSNAINHAAAWLYSNLGPSSGSFDTLAYEGPNDVRAAILTVAAVKVERKVGRNIARSPFPPPNIVCYEKFLTYSCRSCYPTLSHRSEARPVYLKASSAPSCCTQNHREIQQRVFFVRNQKCNVFVFHHCTNGSLKRWRVIMSTTKPGRMQKMILLLFSIHLEQQVSFISLNDLQSPL